MRWVDLDETYFVKYGEQLVEAVLIRLSFNGTFVLANDVGTIEYTPQDVFVEIDAREVTWTEDRCSLEVGTWLEIVNDAGEVVAQATVISPRAEFTVVDLLNDDQSHFTQYGELVDWHIAARGQNLTARLFNVPDKQFISVYEKWKIEEAEG